MYRLGIGIDYATYLPKYVPVSVFLLQMIPPMILLLAGLVLFEHTCAAPANDVSGSVKSASDSQGLNDDLKTAASSGCKYTITRHLS